MSLTFFNNKYATITLLGVTKRCIVNYGFCREYRSVYNAMINKPSDIDATAQNKWVEHCVRTGEWNKCDVIYNFAVHTNKEREAQINWRNPGVHDCSLMNPPTFTQYEGFQGSGTQYIESNWNASVDANNFTLTNAAMGLYSRSASWSDDVMGWYQGLPSISNTMLSPCIGGYTFGALNGKGGEYIADANGYGMYIVSNINHVHSISQLYKNASYLRTVPSDATYLPNLTLTILKWNNGGAPAVGQVSHAFIGGSFSAQEIANWTSYYRTYLKFYGKNVV
jgi:hypothetical protein